MEKELDSWYNVILAVVMILLAVWVDNLNAGQIYTWTDEKGTIVCSDKPPVSGSFKKQEVTEDVKVQETKPTLQEKLKAIDDDYQKKLRDIEYDSKLAKKKDLERKVERLQNELVVVEARLKKVNDQLWSLTGDRYRSARYGLEFEQARYQGQKQGIEDWIRRYEDEISYIKRSL